VGIIDLSHPQKVVCIKKPASGLSRGPDTNYCVKASSGKEGILSENCVISRRVRSSRSSLRLGPSGRFNAYSSRAAA
jgi:hypothetical protein